MLTEKVLPMIKAVDFFCGGGGMTRGMLDAEIEVLAGIDVDPTCKETYELNNGPAKFILEDISKFQPEQLERYLTPAGDEVSVKKNDDNLLFIGCSPCQYWSTMRTDKSRSHKSRNLLVDFKRFISHFNPGHIVIENVPGILTRPESPLKDFLAFLETQGYPHVDHGVIKVWEHGVPQTRKRFVLVASRVHEVSLPKPDKNCKNKVSQFIRDPKKFPAIPPGHVDPTPYCHTTAGLSDRNQRRLAMTPADGGSRLAWAKTELQLPVYAKNDYKESFGFQDVYGRMFWDRPAPTITTRFYSISNGRFAHPDQDRPISLREGAALQTFDVSYGFHAKSIADNARLIGNAVPPELAKRIGLALQNLSVDTDRPTLS